MAFVRAKKSTNFMRSTPPVISTGIASSYQSKSADITIKTALNRQLVDLERSRTAVTDERMNRVKRTFTGAGESIGGALGGVPGGFVKKAGTAAGEGIDNFLSGEGGDGGLSSGLNNMIKPVLWIGLIVVGGFLAVQLVKKV